jgi:hypothetical protein
MAPVKIDNGLSVLPNRNSHTELAEALKILLKERLELFPKLRWVQLHPRICHRSRVACNVFANGLRCPGAPEA